MQEKEIEKEIIEIVKKHSSSLSKADLPFLYGLNSIMNDCTDCNGCKHDNLGRFTKKDKGSRLQQQRLKTDIKNAIDSIIAGKSNEIIVKNIRNDLEQYGGNNDIAFIKGTEKGGVAHFATKHKKDIEHIIDVLIDGKITAAVPNRKVFIEDEDYLAILSLDYFGNKKTWLLTGYKKDK